MTRRPTLTEVLDELDTTRRSEESVSVADAVHALGPRGFGPFLFIPALLEMTPIGSIPGVPTVIATFIALIAVQIVFGKSHLWVPGFVEHRTISSGRLASAIEAVRPVAARFDRWFRPRFPVLTGARAVRVAAAICLLLCLTVPPLEFVPLASTVPMAAIATFGFALMVHDGLLMALGFALTAAALATGIGIVAGG